MPSQSNERRLSVAKLHQTFLEALDSAVISHSDVESKPLEVDLKSPLPPKLRMYIYNATYPPGGRTMGEHKVQLIVPGQGRGERGNFDSSGGRIPALVGYRHDQEYLHGVGCRAIRRFRLFAQRPGDGGDGL